MSLRVRIIPQETVPHSLSLAIVLALVVAGCGDALQTPAEATPATRTAAPVAEQPAALLFVGTSLTAGYGLPSEQSYPARIQERLAARGLAYRAVNAGVSGDTSAGPRRRIGWLLQQPVAAVVLELGANDMLRGQGSSQLRDNLQAIIDEVRALFPEAPIVIAGMRAAPNLGPDYAREFERVFEQGARTNSAAFLPFILDGVAGQPELNQADGIHPTAAGQLRVASNVWAVLQPLLGGVEP